MYEIKPDFITPELILSKISQEDLWEYYLGFKANPGDLFLSPLRDESDPSANLLYASNGDLLLKDFGYKTINIWQLVQYRYNLTFKEALEKVYKDLLLGNRDIKYSSLSNITKRRDITQIGIKMMSFNTEGIDYWKSYHISQKTLKIFKTLQISHLWVNNNQIKISSPTFSYEFGKGYRKIYSPLDSKFKFISNVPGYMFSGYEQLPWVDDLLIITKSHKDVMVFYELGYNAISPQGEGHKIEGEFLDLLKKRFKTVILNFDNDKAGKYHSKDYDLPKLFIPDNDLDLKDISDYIKKYHYEKTLNDLNEWLNNNLQ